jgi:hypothetical protein
MEETLNKKEHHIKETQDDHEATIKKVIIIAFCNYVPGRQKVDNWGGGGRYSYIHVHRL